MGSEKPPQLRRHPIRVVAARTGLSPDVLRVWERRYAAVTPSRSAGGQRLYSDADIERLIRLDRATRAGRGISQVAALPDEEIERLIADDQAAHAHRRAAGTERGNEAGASVDAALGAVRALDAPELERLLRHAAASFGAEQFIGLVLAPLLTKIGEQWESGSLGVAHEHAASAVVHRLLGWIAAAFTVPQNAPVLVIATPAGERHEFGAMLAAATASAAGWRTTYVGSDLPAADIAAAARQAGAQGVALSVVLHDHGNAMAREVDAVRRALESAVPLVLGGRAAVELAPTERDGIRAVEGLSDFARLLRRLEPPRHR